MPRLRPLPKRKVLKILKDNGFKIVSKGKHIKLKKRIKDEKGERVLTTWVSYSYKEIRPDIIKYIIEQTEKPRKDFC